MRKKEKKGKRKKSRREKSRERVEEAGGI